MTSFRPSTRWLCASLLTAAFGLPSGAAGQGVPARAPSAPGTSAQPFAQERSVFLEWESLAQKAMQGGSREIEALAQDMMARSVAFNAGPGVGQRLAAAEAKYRRTQRGIDHADIVKAVNAAVRRFAAPEFMKTSHEQVDLLAEIIDRRVPHLALVSGGEWREPHVVSPVHAGFLTMFLATQKVLNGAYQRDADAWVRETRDGLKRAELSKGKVPFPREERRWDPPRALSAVWSEPRSDTNIMTRMAHGVFDDLGIER